MKYIVPILLLLVWVKAHLPLFQYSTEKPLDHIFSSHQTTAKDSAFIVLRDKCNVCHATKKKTDIFTPHNMDSLAADIHKQVFVKKKMPKGRKIKLTDNERSQLKVWLDETLTEN